VGKIEQFGIGLTQDVADPLIGVAVDSMLFSHATTVGLRWSIFASRRQPSLTSVATPWIFSQDLGFFIRPWDVGFFHEDLGFFLSFLRSPWVFLFFFSNFR